MRKDEQHHRPYPPAYLSAQELAFWLNCAERTVEAYSRVNLLPAPVKIGNLVRWRWSDIEEGIARQNAELIEPVGGGDEYSGGIVQLKAASKRLTGKAADDSAS